MKFHKSIITIVPVTPSKFFDKNPYSLDYKNKQANKQNIKKAKEKKKKKNTEKTKETNKRKGQTQYSLHIYGSSCSLLSSFKTPSIRLVWGKFTMATYDPFCTLNRKLIAWLGNKHLSAHSPKHHYQ